MKLWLLRHAQACDGPSDDARKLTRTGEAQLAALAGFLQRANVKPPPEIWHSPLQRARQTAQLLAETWKGRAFLLENECLLPDADILLVIEQIADRDGDLALVGHQPHLGRLASWLVTMDADADLFLIRNATLLCLETAGALPEEPYLLADWFVSWMVTPDLLGTSIPGGAKGE